MEHNFPSAANTTVFAADTLQTDCCFSKPRTSVNLNQLFFEKQVVSVWPINPADFIDVAKAFGYQ